MRAASPLFLTVCCSTAAGADNCIRLLKLHNYITVTVSTRMNFAKQRANYPDCQALFLFDQLGGSRLSDFCLQGLRGFILYLGAEEAVSEV